jgi:predicted lysophospholipase L1 biosynthesis ABC-type transport system permease subunit
VTGRLAPGRSAGEAEAEVALLAARLRRELPRIYADRDFAAIPRSRVRVLPGVDGKLFAASAFALAGVALVLTIAAANVANLALARGAGRRREIATRLSLGAGPSAIVRLLLTESLVVSALAGGLGLAAAAGALAAVASLRLPLPLDLVLGSALDPRVILFTLALSTLTAVTCGLAPALDAARTDLTAALRDGSGAAPGRRRRRGRSALVIVQIALSLFLLIAAGLAARSLQQVFRIDPGFDADGVVVASFAPSPRGVAAPAPPF